MNKKQGIFILFMVSSLTIIFTLVEMFIYKVSFWEALICTVIFYIVVIFILAVFAGTVSFGRILDMLEDEG